MAAALRDADSEGTDAGFSMWPAMDCFLRWNALGSVFTPAITNLFKTQLTTNGTNYSSGATSNQRMMFAVTHYLAGCVWGTNAFPSGAQYQTDYGTGDPTGMTYVSNTIVNIPLYGLLEHDSLIYAQFTLGPIYTLEQFAPDPVLRNHDGDRAGCEIGVGATLAGAWAGRARDVDFDERERGVEAELRGGVSQGAGDAEEMMRRVAALAVMALAAGTGAPVLAHAAGGAKKGAVERVKVHGKSLEGNLEGDSPDREVLVYLPASYKTSGSRRYPVVYFLHGFTDDPDHWWGFIKHFVNLPEIFDRVFADGSTREVIVAMPNAFTAYQGAMYSNSATTGNWEDFVTGELVDYIDAHYRTIAVVESRGLAGHSMGGYGAMKIGMKHPEIYSSMYVMSACCLSAPTAQSAGRGGTRAEAMH